MIEPEHKRLPVSKQCELRGKSRSWYYYRSTPNANRLAKEARKAAMVRKVSDEIQYYGYRKVALEVSEQYGVSLSFKQAWRLRKKEGIKAVRVPPPTSTPRTAHAVYPYLLGGKHITYANQVWQVDISYVQLPSGTMYLCAILDVFSRKLLAWNLSNTMDVMLVLFPLTTALAEYGAPEIINTDQGSQFTTSDWISMVEDLGIRVSMDGKGRAFDNIYIERWWRSFKYEDLYLNQYQTVSELRRGIGAYVKFYNTRRFHQALDYRRPQEVFIESQAVVEAAA
jgi:putative transposase